MIEGNTKCKSQTYTICRDAVSYNVAFRDVAWTRNLTQSSKVSRKTS